MAKIRFEATQETLDSIVTLGDAEDLKCFAEFSFLIAAINRADNILDLVMNSRFVLPKYFSVTIDVNKDNVIVSQKGMSIILIDVNI